ncbi:MAG TPA: hypothetical protein VNC50_00835, partial [Planctomycetia bacterium]|nr:hypothetical protein [Planctomycetia bacterium]
MTGSRTVLAIALLAVILRAGVAWFQADGVLRFPAHDPDHYGRLAATLASTGSFALETPEGLQPTAHRPPGYPILLAGGIRAGLSVSTAALTVNLVASGFIVLLTAALAHRLLATAPGWIPALAAFLVAVDPLLVHQAGQLMTETTFTAFLLAALLCWTHVIGPNPRMYHVFGAALVLAAGALVRPTMIPIALLLAFVRPSSWKSALAALLLAALFVSPWVVRNHSRYYRIYFTTHGGYTLWLAHNPSHFRVEVEEGRTWEGKEFDDWSKANAEAVRGYSELERDDAFGRMASEWLREDPARAARSMLHRVKSLWTPFPRTGPATLRLPAACFAIALFAAAVVGWIRLGPVSFAGLLLAAPIVATTLLHAVYWSNIR